MNTRGLRATAAGLILGILAATGLAGTASAARPPLPPGATSYIEYSVLQYPMCLLDWAALPKSVYTVYEGCKKIDNGIGFTYRLSWGWKN